MGLAGSIYLLVSALHCIVVMWDRLVAAWFVQRKGKARIHTSNKILSDSVRSISVRTYNKEIFWR